ncbi:hypothetical protein PsYK624_142710 [Phanerochaete sordida]|uniref:Uncharacterized protein n=1 Tax=Phanerochaete sordida TaxID=48140 RepID=A0A9P3LKV3_9APHY|nr:hypothetical protein PsYK624_142710 [Phanerochaete sordida]
MQLVLKHLQLPSFKELIRCIYLTRPHSLELDNVTFVKDDIDAYTAAPPLPRDGTRSLVEGETSVRGEPSILHLPSYHKFLALVHANGDAEMNLARTSVAQTMLQAFECIADDSPYCVTRLSSAYFPAGAYSSHALYSFRGDVSCHVSANVTLFVHERSGLVEFDAVLINLPLGFRRDATAAPLVETFDGLDRRLTELVSATAPPIRIGYHDDTKILRLFLRAILDDGDPLSRALARLSRTRKVTLWPGSHVLDILEELLPTSLLSSVSGWQTILDNFKSQLRVNWIFDVLKRAWSAEDLETALRALEPNPEEPLTSSSDAAKGEQAGQGATGPLGEGQEESAEGQNRSGDGEEVPDEA